jgi:CHASE3 domain sensor protein
MRSVVVNRPSVTGRLEKLAIEVLTALGERDATIAAAEQRAGAALQAMITDESLTVSEAVQWCAGAISHLEAARLRRLTAQAEQRLARG